MLRTSAVAILKTYGSKVLFQDTQFQLVLAGNELMHRFQNSYKFNEALILIHLIQTLFVTLYSILLNLRVTKCYSICCNLHAGYNAQFKRDKKQEVIFRSFFAGALCVKYHVFAQF